MSEKLKWLLFIGALFISQILKAGVTKQNYYYQGIERIYYLYKPLRVSTGILFVLHGGGGKDGGKNLGYFTKMNQVAEESGFYVVYPNSTGTQWNDGRSQSENRIDDVGFLDSLAQELSFQLKIKRENVFVAGISNGGMMTARLACEGHQFYGFAMIAANLPVEQKESCTNDLRKPILVVNGTSDKIMPWFGGQIKKSSLQGVGGTVLSGEKTMQFWLKKNFCSSEKKIIQLPDINKQDQSVVFKRTYLNCEAPTYFYVVRGGGHSWPGSRAGTLYDRFAGPTNKDINTSKVIWETFSQFIKY